MTGRELCFRMRELAGEPGALGCLRYFILRAEPGPARDDVVLAYDHVEKALEILDTMLTRHCYSP